MNRSFKINFALLCVVLLLAIVAWFSANSDKQPPTALLTKLQPVQVSSISIENRNGSKFILERKDNSWFMTSPYQTPANTQRIEHLLEIAHSLSISRFEAPDNLETFGLTSPLAKLQLNQTQILVGKTHPMNHRRYLLHGSQIHLINDRFIHHLQASAEEFIDHMLLPKEAKIQSITTPQWSISHSPDGQILFSPEDEKISQDIINNKLDSWKIAAANRVISAAEKKANDSLEIRFHAREPISFEIAQAENQTLLIRNDLGIAYVLSTTSTLLDPPAEKK